MTKRMLIDATHAEETRVVVLDGTRLEDFDVETSTKKQLKGNIYLAKVVRVEPSLQAAFVEYGGGRHGFLAFGEIHPDYYQIPVADRQRLLAMQEEEARREEEEEDRAASAEADGPHEDPDRAVPELEDTTGDLFEAETAAAGETSAEGGDTAWSATDDISPSGADDIPRSGTDDISPSAADDIPRSGTDDEGTSGTDDEGTSGTDDEGTSGTDDEGTSGTDDEGTSGTAQPLAIANEALHVSQKADAAETWTSTLPDGPVLSGTDDPLPAEQTSPDELRGAPERAASDGAEEHHVEPAADLPLPETVGGDADPTEETRSRRPPPRFLRNYKIQEVIRRRQILLVQVVKEERGTKGAALTTYLSLAGRYSVLMPNSPRGGGISRKITSAADRRRLKEITSEMDLPQGMGLIVRTAGANRPKPEIKRDCEYLMRLWDDIREHTLKSVAPALIYEEASLIKRAIRDVYSRDVEEIVVDGEDGWKAARDFMRMLMPTHAKKVQLWRDGGMPLFARNQVEAQLDGMMMPTVQLRSGGYLVINQTEALVAIDVNSGRSTRERNIEETALRTNLEASDEVARQLRLRDLAGLIVIDFIDMESRKHNGMVEKRLKDALKNDRARIQVGHISHFGLLEMSRQRLRPSLAETSFVMCPQCGGTGHVRSVESAALHVLRHIEEEGAKRRAAEIVVHVAGGAAMYILNHKRDLLHAIEQRYAMHVTFQADDALIAPQMRIERVRAQAPGDARAITADAAPVLPRAPEPDMAEEEQDASGEETEDVLDAAPEAPASSAEGESGDEQRRRRRRRRRRGGRRDEAVADGAVVPGLASAPDPEPAEHGEDGTDNPPATPEAGSSTAPSLAAPGPAADSEDAAARGRRRGRRGGRRLRRGGEEDVSPVAELGAEQPEIPAAPYQGPTPANPFGAQGFDIFDVIEQAEQARPAAAAAPAPVPDRESELEAAAAEVASPKPELPDTGAVAPEPPPIVSAPELARGLDVAEAAEPADVPHPAATEPPQAGPAPEPPPTAAEASRPEPEPEPRPEPEPESKPPPNAVRPILIGAADAPVAEKKRGWWRR